MTQLETSRPRSWSVRRMRDGTDYFLSQLDKAGHDLARPSALIGWQRASVVAHVARNADALGRLVDWAATGVESPMYAGPAQRDAEIAESAAQPVDILLADARHSADRLDHAVASLPEDAWTREVRTAHGRLVSASEIPWLRLREVWVDGVDLNAGGAMSDLPPDVIDALLDDVIGTFSARDAGGEGLRPAQGVCDVGRGASDRSRQVLARRTAGAVAGRVRRCRGGSRLADRQATTDTGPGRIRSDSTDLAVTNQVDRHSQYLGSDR
jgi:maleylpyruvate isomerase